MSFDVIKQLLKPKMLNIEQLWRGYRVTFLFHNMKFPNLQYTNVSTYFVRLQSLFLTLLRLDSEPSAWP